MLFLVTKIRLFSYNITTYYLRVSVLFIFPYKTSFFSFTVFLLYNDVYFEYTQRYKKDKSKRTQRLYKRIGFTKQLFLKEILKEKEFAICCN